MLAYIYLKLLYKLLKEKSADIILIEQLSPLS